MYTGDSLSTLAFVASNDDSGGVQSQVGFNPIIGQTYQIAVDGYYSSVGDITLNLRTYLPPANDNFSNSTVLQGLNITTTGSNTAATGESGEPDHAGVSFFGNPSNAESVWWSWTAPTDAVVRIDTFGSNYDTTLAVYRGTSIGNLREVESNNDYLGNQSAVFIDARAGETYRIAVDGFDGRDGDIVLNLTEVTLPTPLGGKNLVPPDLPVQSKASQHSHVFFPDSSRAAYDPDSVPKGAKKLQPNVFSKRSNANVFDATTTPWTSVNAEIGDNSIGDNSTDPLTGPPRALWAENDIDFYQVTARAGQKLTIDIDNAIGGNGSFDSMVWLFNSDNELVARNDDYFFDSGTDPGSISNLDSFLKYDVQKNGQYYVAVSSYGNFWDGNSWTSFAGGSGDYTVNISLG